jgi:uncharacterized membrane protein YphA (DoxX/SURF4 family)
MVFFGLQQFIISDFVPALLPLPSGIPGYRLLVYLIGLTLIATALCLVTNLKPRLTATLLGLFWVFCFLLLHIPKLIANPRVGGVWAPALEVLAFGGGALILAGSFPGERPPTGVWDRVVARVISCGSILFGITLPVFGVQHFLYVDYVAGVIPAWIPGHVFWAYFTGVAHICAGISIITGIKARLSSALLALMFGLWVVLLHIPRATVIPRSRNEWTSAIVALAMCGASLLISGTLARKAVFAGSDQVEIESAVGKQQLVGTD